MLLLNIDLPSKSRALLIAISDMANFDFLSFFDSTTYFFGSYAFTPSTRTPFKPSFVDLYPSMNFIENLGTSFYFIILAFVGRLLLLELTFIRKYFRLNNSALNWVIKKLKNKLTAEFYIRIFLQTHFGLLFSSMINLQTGSFATTWLDYLCMALSCLTLLFNAAFQFFAAHKVYRLWKTKTLISNAEEKRWGILYTQYLSPMNSGLAKLEFESFQMMRRVITVCTLMWVPSTPGIQIGFLLYTCTFWSGYTLSCRPFESLLRNCQEVFNNSCFSILLYLGFEFTPFCTDAET
jgi:hypothetical protein